jgi:hypothetical protein
MAPTDGLKTSKYRSAATASDSSENARGIHAMVVVTMHRWDQREARVIRSITVYILSGHILDLW